MRKNGKLYPKKICGEWLLCKFRRHCSHARVHSCRRIYAFHAYRVSGCEKCVLVDDGVGGKEHGQEIPSSV